MINRLKAERIAALLVVVSLQVRAFTAAPLNLPSLPEPVTNNAVASARVDDELHIMSFMGP